MGLGEGQEPVDRLVKQRILVNVFQSLAALLIKAKFFTPKNDVGKIITPTLLMPKNPMLQDPKVFSSSQLMF